MFETQKPAEAKSPATTKTPAKVPAKPSAPKTSEPKLNKLGAAKKPPAKKSAAKPPAKAPGKSAKETAFAKTNPAEILNPAEMSKRLESATAYIKNEVSNAAQSFLRIGFKLWQVREDKLYIGGNFGSVVEYAGSAFGLQKSSVQNYIAVCERYSEKDKDGKPTDKLAGGYSGFSYGQLSIMLPLPDEKVQDISPGLTCKEIREIKKEEQVKKDLSGSSHTRTRKNGKVEIVKPADNPKYVRVGELSLVINDETLPKIAAFLKGHKGCTVSMAVFQ
jgi:hypothetical protein